MSKNLNINDIFESEDFKLPESPSRLNKKNRHYHSRKISEKVSPGGPLKKRKLVSVMQSSDKI
jgi:hypothetical protein